MAESVHVAVFEGGDLRLIGPSAGVREVVLGLPLSRLIIKPLRIPAEARDDVVGYATPILQALSPFADEPLTVSCETVSDDERGLVVLAAALPDSAADDIAGLLDARKFSVTRVDSLAVGLLRGLWSSLGDGSARRLVVINAKDGLELFVLDGDGLAAVRAVSAVSDFRREAMLLLLEAEDFAGPKALAESVIVAAGGAEFKTAPLEAFGPVRRLEVGEDAAAVGLAERSTEAGALNALPASWGEVLDETRFKRKLVRGLAVAGAVWVLALGVLFGVPVAYGFRTNHMKQLCKEHARKYNEVKDMKARVELVRNYSDHSRGALEILKAISDRAPAGVTLLNWNYKREEGVSFKGEADRSDVIYDFKETLEKMAFGEGDDAEKAFALITLNGPVSRAGRHTFEIVCQYKTEEE